VNAETAIPVESRPRWRRRVSAIWRRRGFFPFVELGTALLLVATLVTSYFVISRVPPDSTLAPETVAALLVANLVPAMGLMVLFARRVAMRRAARSEIGGRGRLHVRLAALFSVIAIVPTLLVVIFASLLFQSGLQFWFSGNAETILRNAENVARVYRDDHMTRIEQEAEAMGEDIVREINAVGIESPTFTDWVLIQKVYRTLSEAAVISVTPSGVLQTHVVVDLDGRPMERRVSAAALRQLRAGETIVATDAGDRVEAVIRLDPDAEVYLYVSRYLNPEALRLIDEAGRAASGYQRTLDRSRRLQLRFNAILILVSLLIIALAIWIALKLADRLVRPVGELVGAAKKVTAGDLSARVPVSDARDEVGTLGNAFNRMTRRLEEQTGDLVKANAQLETRRAFTEAVLAGVTAGVISVDEDHVVRLINSSAEALLKTGGQSPVGQKLVDLAPELDRQLTAAEREDVVQFASRGEPRTLAVKTVKVKGGHVLTFDDITEQLLDQRRAAWSDVARRIAHEIKNPLTPIQLAAERLQRRYADEVKSDPSTFERLTGTIVRQVGDLRRMVDEFSSFARMPKPSFEEEPVAEIARHALFLLEVAHPDIEFRLDAPDPSPMLVCDRRLLGQAFTNVVKNAVEAIQQKYEEQRPSTGPDFVAMTIRQEGAKLVIEVSDTGVGLPADRGRLTEPYMTTRAKGTGLGLAIVKKIVEEHFGQIEFGDLPDGGSLVRFLFDAEVLARLGDKGVKYSEERVAGG
jgi:two-component system nitrogen regulation sensor histidine kinase NtrY